MLIFLKVAALIVLILHGVSYFLPAERWWGVSPYTVFPPVLGWGLLLAAATTLLPPLNRRWRQVLAASWHRLPGRAHPRRWFALAAIAAAPIFWLLRIRHLQWGDAQILVIGLSQKDAPVLYNWQAPFTVFLHQRLWQLLAYPLWGWGVDTVYAAVSVLCGVAFVFVGLVWAHATGQSTAERALLTGLVLTGGGMQLFFGYVENYTIISLGVMLFLYFGWRALQNETPLWVASAVLALTNAFHPSTIVLWGAMAYLGWRKWRAGLSLWELLQAVLLPPLLVGSAVLSLMEIGNHGLAAFLGDDRPGGGDHVWFVPLTLAAPTQWQRYAMFSAAHFADWGNEMLLTAPLGIFMPVGAAMFLWRKWRQMTAQIRTALIFFAAAAFGYLLLTWVWNADYGMRKDWDLFSPAAITVNVLAGVLWANLLRGDDEAPGESALIVWAVAGLHTLAWVLSNVLFFE